MGIHPIIHAAYAYIHVHTPSQPKPKPPPRHLPKTHPDSPQLRPTATRPSSVSVHGRRHVGLLTLGNHGDGGADAESPFSVGRASVGRSPRDDVTECGLLGQTERGEQGEEKERVGAQGEEQSALRTLVHTSICHTVYYRTRVTNTERAPSIYTPL